jgi:exopolysaccharide biosynthesis predicted pyruvyltransferase EpsI
MRWPDELYDELLTRLRGHSVGLAVNRFGNFGDGLIQRGTLELLQRHGVTCRLLREDEIAGETWPTGVTLVAEPGGGNLGTRPGLSSPKRRMQLAKLPGPKIILPQSASDPHEDLSAFETVFVREETSWRMLRTVHPDVRLVPDMALLLDLEPSTPVHQDGTFMRDDIERYGSGGVDPAQLVSSVDAYIALAGSYRRVVTNRLHFAIAALLQGQSAVLKASCYHKNRSMFDAWLHRFSQAAWGD